MLLVFIFRSAGSHEFTLQQYLNRQKHILHGYEARKLKHVPKVCLMSDDHAVKSFRLFQTQLGLETIFFPILIFMNCTLNENFG